MGFKPKTMTETLTVPPDVLPHDEGSAPLEVTIKTTLTRVAPSRRRGDQWRRAA